MQWSKKKIKTQKSTDIFGCIHWQIKYNTLKIAGICNLSCFYDSIQIHKNIAQQGICRYSKQTPENTKKRLKNGMKKPPLCRTNYSEEFKKLRNLKPFWDKCSEALCSTQTLHVEEQHNFFLHSAIFGGIFCYDLPVRCSLKSAN